jgi:hypothetical protein
MKSALNAQTYRGGLVMTPMPAPSGETTVGPGPAHSVIN